MRCQNKRGNSRKYEVNPNGYEVSRIRRGSLKQVSHKTTGKSQSYMARKQDWEAYLELEITREEATHFDYGEINPTKQKSKFAF